MTNRMISSLSHLFDLTRGTRQGCSLLPLLPLAIALTRCKCQGSGERGERAQIVIKCGRYFNADKRSFEIFTTFSDDNPVQSNQIIKLIGENQRPCLSLVHVIQVFEL